MSFEITTNFVQQYASNMAMLAQQRTSRFERHVMVQTITGTRGSYDQVGQSEAVERTVQHAPTPFTPLPHRRRWCALKRLEWADLIDQADQVRLLAEPSSSYARAGIAAMNRGKDRQIVAAFFADAITGENGETTVSFPAANQIAVNSWKYGSGSGNAGLTISKLIEARALLLDNEAGEGEDDQDLGEACFAVTSKQWGDIMATTEATSKDFNFDVMAEISALRSGKINKFLGFNIVRYKDLPVDGSGYRRIPVWQKQGMLLGKGTRPTPRISELAEKSYSTQVYYADDYGATRTEEARVIEIKCLET